MTPVAAGDYDPNRAFTSVPSRHIPLSVVRDAANTVYMAPRRTPLVSVEGYAGAACSVMVMDTALAVVSGGNIDLLRVASLVGACIS